MSSVHWLRRPRRIVRAGRLDIIAIGAALLLGARSPAIAQSTGSIVGTVIDVGTRQPVSDARVSVTGTSATVLTDTRGRYRIVNVAAGTVTIAAQRIGYAPQTKEVRVEVARAVEVSFVLDQQASVIAPMAVTANGHDEEELDRLPVTIGVVSGAALREMRPTHVGQPLNRIAGARIVEFEGDGTHNTIRQPLCCKATLLILEDGIPFTSSAYYTTSQLNRVNYAQAGRVEVLKGPGTAVYGSDAVSGVINFITAAPPLTPQVAVSLEGGGYGYKRGLVTAGGTFGRHGLQLDMNVVDAEGRRTPYQRQSGTLRWTATSANGAVIKSVLSYNNLEGVGSDDQTLEQFRARSRFNPYPIAFNDARALRASSSYQQQFGRTTVSVTPFYRRNNTDMVPGWQLSYNPVVWDVDNWSAGGLAQLRHEFPAWQSTLTAGFDVDYTDGNRREPTITPVETQDAEGRTVWSNWSLTAESPQYDYDIVYRGAAGYVQVETSPVERLRLTAGMRYDRASYDYSNNLSVVTDGFVRRPPNASLSYDRLTPKFGATFQLRPATTLFASYRSGFRVPIESQLFKQGSSANTLALEPIDVRGTEFGVRQTVAGRVRVELVGYDLRLDNDILSFRDPNGRTAATNNGRTSHSGVELSASAGVRRDLQMDVAYSYAKHTFDRWQVRADRDLSGKEMDGAPRHLRNVYLTYTPRLLGGGSVSLEWTGISGYWLDGANTKRESGYDVANLRASYFLTPRLELFGRLMNVGDKLYAQQAFDGFGDVDRLFSPGELRTFYAGIRTRF